jgi:hypothetical protein
MALTPIKADITKTKRRVIPLRFDIHHPVSSGKRCHIINELKGFFEFKIVFDPQAGTSLADGCRHMTSKTLRLLCLHNLAITPHSVL